MSGKASDRRDGIGGGFFLRSGRNGKEFDLCGRGTKSVRLYSIANVSLVTLGTSLTGESSITSFGNSSSDPIPISRTSDGLGLLFSSSALSELSMPFSVFSSVPSSLWQTSLSTMFLLLPMTLLKLLSWLSNPWHCCCCHYNQS